jgi:hypothetical protein
MVLKIGKVVCVLLKDRNKTYFSDNICDCKNHITYLGLYTVINFGSVHEVELIQNIIIIEL